MLTYADIDVAVALPDHWYQVPLQPDERDQRIARLVSERVSPDLSSSTVRRALTEALRRMAAVAYDAGALICASMTLTVPDEVVGAHLVVTLATDADPGEVSFEEVDLPRVGVVERTTLRRRLDVLGSAQVLTTLEVRYDVPIATAPGMRVRLTFGSPSLLYAVPLLAMFDLIASSVHAVQA